MKRRGQILSVDLIVALAIFAFLLIGIMGIWRYAFEKNQMHEDHADLEQVAKRASDVLFLTSGNPPYWHEQGYENVTTDVVWSAGLRQDHWFDADKISFVAGMNETVFSRFLQILGVMGPRYNLSISYYREPDFANPLIQAGYAPRNATQSVVHQAAGVDVNGSLVKLKVIAWR
ncbi:MAG: hypothetical protein ACOCWQ_01365 [Nanoarchaeota archaeon]